jgi:hypothetical protein
MDRVSFSTALAALRQGKRISREGWNGKGMFVYYVPGASYPAQTPVAKAVFGEMVPYRTYFVIHGADGMVSTWVPSSTDLDAEDWEVLNEDGTPYVSTPLDRLQDERLELHQRIEHVTTLLRSQAFLELAAPQRELLISQLDAMKRYCSVLTQREVGLQA